MHLHQNFIRGAIYLAFGLIVDAAGITVLVGIGLAAYRRYVVRPDRLESGLRDALPLVLIAVVVLSGFLLKGLRIVATSDPWAAWSPVGYASAWLLGLPLDADGAVRLHQFLWYGHAALAFGLIALIPWTKLLHILSVPLSLYFSFPLRTRMATPSLAGDLPRGARTVAQCTRKQLIEADACIECGRCKKLCPIFLGGTPFAPMSLMKNLRTLMRPGGAGRSLVGAAIDEAALGSCTLCLSCEERCPVGGQHGSGIMEIRRGAVEEKRIPAAVAARFEENSAALANASASCKPQPGCEVYLWPGCGENRVDQSAILQSVRNLLYRAGVTFSVLEPPACCGGPLRRLGNEALFRKNAALNMPYLHHLKNATLVVCCPHCFNTLKNEYPPFGNDLEIMHHAQYLAGLAAAGKLPPAQGVALKAVYHDPCFLGRYNEQYESARILLEGVDGLSLVDMKHSRQKSFCCGSGGGTVASQAAVEIGRQLLGKVAKEGAQAIVTACPYCRENLQAVALREAPDNPLVVRDVAEFFDQGEVA
jgi:Fe-S oxidoreductase